MVFGQSRETISQNIGLPEKKDIRRDEERWNYRLLRLELSFSQSSNFKLSQIISRHPYTLVLGFNPIGLKETYLIQKFPNLVDGIGDALDEPSLGLTFTLSQGAVACVTMQPQKDNLIDEYIWPES